jgi:RNA polymerase sigma-70 factor (ECF subfamily)
MRVSAKDAPHQGSALSETQLDVEDIRRIRDGDAEAYAPIVRRHLPRLRALMFRFFRNGDDADDMSQAALVRAYERLDSFDQSRPFFPWLRRIAVNLALHEIERRRRQATSEEAEKELQGAAALDASDAAIDESELIECTQRELERMPPNWAAVFRLRAFEELSYADIADTLGIPMGTVMSRLARARARLAEALAHDFGPHSRGQT